MKAKFFTGFIISLALLVTLVLAVSSPSATITPSTFSKSANSSNILVIPASGESINITSISAPSISFAGKTVQFLFNQTVFNGLTSANPANINLRLTGDIRTFAIGEFTSTANITYVNSSDSSQVGNKLVDLRFRSGFCAFGPAGTNLSIRDTDISNSGDNDDEWKPLDTVDVEVKVENNGDDDIEDVQVEMALLDSDGIDRVGDLDFTNSDEEKYDLNTIKDGDDKTATFSFRVPADLDSGSYKLVFKAYSKDSGESRDCADEVDGALFQDISVDKEDEDEKSVIVDDIELPEQATCGETISGAFTVFNIGTNDQDQILVELMNRDLKLNQEFVIRENIDEGDDKTMQFSFVVPSTIKDGVYTLQFNTLYDYDDGDYDTESEDAFIKTIQVIGCSESTGSTESGVLDVSAALTSEAVAGESIVITSRIKNTAANQQTITVDLSDYESWSELVDISDSSFTLQAGQSKTVTIELKAKPTATGTKSVVIEATSAGQTESQEVEVAFSEAQGSETGSSFDLSGNNLIWVIGAINVILLVLIIVVAVRFSRR